MLHGSAGRSLLKTVTHERGTRSHVTKGMIAGGLDGHIDYGHYGQLKVQ